jgi:hypothetical protein
MTASTMQERIRSAGGGHPHLPAELHAWLCERLRWDDRVRMMGQAAALRGEPLDMTEEPVAADDPQPAGHV